MRRMRRVSMLGGRHPQRQCLASDIGDVAGPRSAWETGATIADGAAQKAQMPVCVCVCVRGAQQ